MNRESELRRSGSFLKDMEHLGRKPQVQFLEQPSLIPANGEVADHLQIMHSPTNTPSLHGMRSNNKTMERYQINQAIHHILSQQLRSQQLRIGMGVDFHSLYDGYPLILAGIVIPFDKGFHVRRSDGDPLSHALVDALLAALGEGDIADWFNDQDGVTDAHSINYLKERLLRGKVSSGNNRV